MPAAPVSPGVVRAHLAETYTYDELAAIARHFGVEFADITAAPRGDVAEEIVRAVVRQRRLPELAELLAGRAGSGRPDPVAARAPRGITLGPLLFIGLALCSLILLLARVVIPAIQVVSQPGRLEEVIYAESFDEPGLPWTEPAGGAVLGAVEDGAFRVTLAAEETPGQWRQALGQNAGDFAMIALVTTDAVAGDGRYGLFFRAAGGREYRFLLDTAGRYTLERGDTTQAVTLVPWRVNRAIHTGPGARNHLIVRARGPVVEVAVNETTLDRVRDPAFMTGDFGPLAEVAPGGRLTLRWDDFLVRALR